MGTQILVVGTEFALAFRAERNWNTCSDMHIRASYLGRCSVPSP